MALHSLAVMLRRGSAGWSEKKGMEANFGRRQKTLPRRVALSAPDVNRESKPRRR